MGKTKDNAITRVAEIITVKKGESELPTVNILEMTEGLPCGIRSFVDDDKGNKEAEKLFAQLARENAKNIYGGKDAKISKANMESYIEDGSFTAISGYELYIIHSS